MSETNHHPATVLKQDWIDTIRNNATDSELQGMLTAPVLSLIYRQGWFNILVPQAYGGAQLSLPDAVKLEEALAWADGSMGWVVTLCAGAGWFGGFLQPSFAGHIFSNNKVCLGGSGAVTGTAEITGAGYKVNGKWLHASGAPHCTVFTANCLITKNGLPVKDATGNDTILSFAFLKDEVAIIPDWNAIGMIATASYPYQVTDVVVPAERTFKISPDAIQVNAPLYQYPFLQLAEATLAANISGIAIHFIDLCEQLFETKLNKNKAVLINNEQVLAALLKVKKDMKEARTNMYHALDHSWLSCVQHATISAELLHMVSISSRNLAKIARQSVDELYPLCGLSAADRHTEINRVWRDLHTASQHSLLNFSR